MTPNPPPNSQNDAMKALMDGRSDLAETRLAVNATQIVERLRIRASHLKELMAEELEVDTKLLQLRDASFGQSIDMMGLESKLSMSMSQIRGTRRREDTECWRDLANVMRDFLNAWDGFSRNEAKNRFLAALPDSNRNAFPNPDSQGAYHNDNRINHYPKH